MTAEIGISLQPRPIQVIVEFHNRRFDTLHEDFFIEGGE
jgi:hypothetical protein